MDAVEKYDTSLIKAINGASKPEAEKPIPLSEDLKQIGVNTTHIVGNYFDELMHGEGRDARDRVAGRGNPIKIVLERSRKHEWK